MHYSNRYAYLTAGKQCAQEDDMQTRQGNQLVSIIVEDTGIKHGHIAKVLDERGAEMYRSNIVPYSYQASAIAHARGFCDKHALVVVRVTR